MYRPIDGQLTLASALLRDTSAVSRHSDSTQAFQAHQAKIAAERQQQSVTKLGETNKATIRDNDGGGQRQQYENMRHTKNQIKEPESGSAADGVVAYSDPYGASFIDISV